MEPHIEEDLDRFLADVLSQEPQPRSSSPVPTAETERPEHTPFVRGCERDSNKRKDAYPLEPPLARLYCTGCKDHWDAWVDEDGDLEDVRDARCGTCLNAERAHTVLLCHGDC